MLEISELNREDSSLILTAKQKGWEEALFDFNTHNLLQGMNVTEDQRSADWRYLIRGDKTEEALIIGSDWGTNPFTLCNSYQAVHIVDSNKEKINFLNIRMKQQKKKNLQFYYRTSGTLPDFRNRFSLIYLNDPYDFFGEISLRKILFQLKPYLQEKGSLYFGVSNRLWSPQSAHLQTLVGYRKTLKEEGFDPVQFYAPLPSHRGTPLFHIPLDSPGAIHFFFRKIFPLFDMVSPEAKQQYAQIYRLAKIGGKIALTLKLTRLTKYFLPSFTVFAQKKV